MGTYLEESARGKWENIINFYIWEDKALYIHTTLAA